MRWSRLPVRSEADRITRGKSLALEETDWQIGLENCAPDCALTSVYPRQTPSVTGRHGERRLGGQVVETTAENVIRYVSTLLQRTAFQACSFNHSDISPCRIKHLREPRSNRK